MWSLTIICVLCTSVLILCKNNVTQEDEKGLLVFTVATQENDGFRRFMSTAKKHGYNVQVLGQGQKWTGGEITLYPGGGQKVRLLREALEGYKTDGRIILFVDSYDVVFTSGPEQLLKTFHKFNTNVLFSAETFCWPDISLKDKYPAVKQTESRFLNSGGFMGRARDIYSILETKDIADNDDDQLFYTNAFLSMRKTLKIKLDTKSEIFQNLHGVLNDVQLKFKGDHSYLYNSKTGNKPSIVHGNGPIKHIFNQLANYLNDRWTPTEGCVSCRENTINLKNVPDQDYPSVLMAIFLDHPIPFLDVFFKYVSALKYPKSKISLYIVNADTFNENEVREFMDLYGKEYKKTWLVGPNEMSKVWKARNDVLETCLSINCQYYFSLEGEVHLESPDVLLDLIEYNRSIIAPLLRRPDKLWSNCWGDLTSDGYYKRSDDYLDIVNYVKIGQWNVPYISGAVLIHGSRVAELHGAYVNGDLDQDMAFSRTAREKGMFMLVDNQKYYGYLVDSDKTPTSHLHNDLYHIASNKRPWTKKYIHEDYDSVLNGAFEDLKQPCPDVFWFPVVNPKFCTDLIDEMEKFGEWSGSSNDDVRLSGGYENVPTDDIHTNQIGWEDSWLYFLSTFIKPMNEKAYLGYFTESRAALNFVVRYTPTAQNSLRPHQDSSTFSINLALNLDFEGGGTKFNRYNCNVTDMKLGWALMHPGKLTHHHEGLPVTKGTRYIMVSFVDP